MRKFRGRRTSRIIAESQYFMDKILYYEFRRRARESGVTDVVYNGEECLFFYSRSGKDYTTVCGLVPLQTVTSQAEEIRMLTIKWYFLPV